VAAAARILSLRVAAISLALAFLSLGPVLSRVMSGRKGRGESTKLTRAA
jgi:hypothetical protein